MRKEPILAVVLGSLLGVVVAFGVWQYSRSLNNKSSEFAVGEVVTEVKSPTIKQEFSLLKPINNSVATNSEITVNGLSNSNSIIAILYGDKNMFTRSSDKGEFEEIIEVSGGLNNVSVYSFTQEKKANENVQVVYSSQIENSPNLKLMLGTVTDISENTIQIKTAEDIIEQISVREDTTYATTVTKSEEIEFSKIALGDFLATIGVKNSENNVFEALRVIVTSLPEESKNNVVYGKIKELSSSEFLVEDFENGEFSVDATGKVNVTKLDNSGEFVKARLAETKQGEEIILTGQIVKDELVASRIHIFPAEKE